MAEEKKLARRDLGHTGEQASVLGLGGFHQVESLQETIDQVVARYLEAGGNYIETARSYGRGASETKLGRALRSVDRSTYLLSSKTGARSEEEAWEELNRSLEALQTDHLDVWFFHGVNDAATVKQLAEPGGALAAFQRARAEGLIRFIGLSSHWPLTYIEAARRLPLDVVLIWGNYLDFCNFPEIPNVVLPALRAERIGVTFMKPVADGFLYRSPELAFRYALAQDVDCVVAGFNSLDMLETDLDICMQAGADDQEACDDILRQAPELETVCRQCAVCSVLPGDGGERCKRVFELEGKFDRQMDSRKPCSAADYALRERLKGWFNTAKWATDTYASEGQPAEALLSKDLQPCRYGIDVRAKLQLVHAKLTGADKLV